MLRRLTRLSPLLLVTLLAIPLWSQPARSYSPYLDQVRSLYPYDFACTVCHDPEDHRLTNFGQDFAKALKRRHDPYQALQDIEPLDSDKDGVANGDELKAGTLPEDSFSRPAKAKPSPSAEPSPSVEPTPSVAPSPAAKPERSPAPTPSRHRRRSAGR